MKPITKFHFCHDTLWPVYLEARPFGLFDFQRLDAVAELLNPIGGVVRRARRQIAFSELFDANDLHRVKIDDRPDPFDWSDVAVVGRVGAQEAKRPGQPLAFLGFFAVIAGTPDIDHDQAGVGQAVLFLQGGREFGACQHSLLALDLFVDGHRRLHAGNLLPREHRLFRNGDCRFVTGVRRVVEKDRECRARQTVHSGMNDFF